MLERALFGLLALALLTFSSCEKEDEEPFEYPDTEITEPALVSHMIRKVIDSDDWQSESSEEGCVDGFPLGTYVKSEVNTTRQFATMHLVPDDSACALEAHLTSLIRPDEIASSYWENWKLEFTFSELRLNENTELRLNLDYREVELSIDLAPIMRETITDDTGRLDTNGLFSMSLSPGFTEFALNGELIDPDFSSDSGNVFEIGGNAEDPKVSVDLVAENTDQQSLIVFTFIRVSSFGIPEPED